MRLFPALAVVKRPDFRRLLSTRLLAVMGLQAQDIVIGWQVYSLTHSPFMLGLTGLTEAIPALACALWAGHVVDTHRPHRVFQWAMGVLMLTSLVLCIIAGGNTGIQGRDLLPVLFIGIFISGLARSFIMPSSASLLAQTVPRSDIASALAWMSSGFQLAAISGPAIVGLLYGKLGVEIAWILPVTVMFVGFVVFSCMGETVRQFKPAMVREPVLKSIRGGWEFIIHNPVLLSVMLLDMFAVLFGGAVAMLPAYADQVLHVGSEGLGLLRAATAIGAILTAIFLALRPLKIIRATTLLWAVTGFGACIIAFGLSTSFALSMFFLAASGAFDSVSMVIRGTLMQLLTTDAVRGRVTAVNSMFIISSNEIGAFESGFAAKLFGLVPSVVIGGAMCLVVVATTACISPKFRRTEVKAYRP